MEDLSRVSSDELGHESFRIVTDNVLGKMRQAENLTEKLAAMIERLDVLHSIDESILRSESPEAIADETLRYLERLDPLRRMSVARIDLEARRMSDLAASVNGAPSERIDPTFDEIRMHAKEIETLRRGENLIRDLGEDSDDSALLRRFIELGGHHWLFIPLLADGALIGSLNLSSDRSEVVTAEVLEVARQVASRLAVATYQADLRAQLDEWARFAALTADVDRLRTQSDSLGGIAAAIVDRLDVAFARIWTLDPQSDVLELKASAGMYTHLDGAHSRVQVGQLKIGLIASERKPHLTNRVIGDPRVADQEWAKREGMVAFAGYPLLVGERLVGVMAMFARRRISEVAFEALGAIADGVALAIDRLRAQLEVRRSDQYFRLLIEHSEDVITVLNRDGSRRYQSPAIERVLGFKPQDLKGKPVLERVHSDDRPKLAAIHEQSLKMPGATLEFEYRAQHRDGSWRVLEARLTNLLREPAIAGMVVNSRDVTERKRMEEELALQGAALAAAANGIVITDLEGRVLWINPAFARLTGYPIDEVIGVNLRILKSGTHDRAFYDHLWKTILSGQVWAGEMTQRRKDGTVYVEEMMITPIRRGDVVSHFIAITQDITARKRSEDDLREALEKAKEADRLKSAFLANMSHEVRTPLNVIRGYNSLIADRLMELHDDTLIPALEAVDQASDRLLQTIDGIIDLSRIESGTFVVQLGRMNLIALASEGVGEFRKTAEEKHLSLALEIELADAEVLGDEYSLKQSLHHLLHNAIKFTEKGKIVVRLYRDASGAVCLAIRDTGIGIDPAYVPRLFEPFSQEQAGTTRPFEGPGIGLALVRRYLDASHAEIFAESEKGEGATFTIRFPASGDETARQSRLEGGHKASGEPANVRRPLVLVVEDDELSRNYAATVLRAEFDITLASSAAEAREQLAAHSADVAVILMDLSLKGGESGLILTRWLRAGSRWKDIPVIATTAYALPEHQRAALDAGCIAHLAKPFSREELLTAVWKAVLRGTRRVTEPSK